jgi:hypothetical protein
MAAFVTLMEEGAANCSWPVTARPCWQNLRAAASVVSIRQFSVQQAIDRPVRIFAGEGKRQAKACPLISAISMKEASTEAKCPKGFFIVTSILTILKIATLQGQSQVLYKSNRYLSKITIISSFFHIIIVA